MQNPHKIEETVGKPEERTEMTVLEREIRGLIHSVQDEVKYSMSAQDKELLNNILVNSLHDLAEKFIRGAREHQDRGPLRHVNLQKEVKNEALDLLIYQQAIEILNRDIGKREV